MAEQHLVSFASEDAQLFIPREAPNLPEAVPGGAQRRVDHFRIREQRASFRRLEKCLLNALQLLWVP